MIDRVIGRGERIDLSTRRFHFRGDGTDRTTLGALENHVFMDMRGTGNIRRFIGTPCLHPHLDGDDGSKMILLDNNAKAVLKCEQ